MESIELARRARVSALAKKAADVIILDVRGLSPITDCVVLASGTSAPHLRAIVGEVERELKQAHVHAYRRSGQPDDGWIALDYVDMVMHVLLTDMREYYAFEELWADVPRIE